MRIEGLESDDPLFPMPVCACGHPMLSHHLVSASRARTYCTVWSALVPRDPGGPCGCPKFTQPEDPE